MAPRVFLTGATGFIGGEVLRTIYNAHPDWDWACLIRNKDKGAKVTAIFPNVRLVYGQTDDVDMIEKEASIADVVIHTAGSDDHEPSAKAIIRGLDSRDATRPAYYIHTSGAFALADETVRTRRYGEDSAPHRSVDKIILAANSGKIKTAIVSPSVVYGEGRGPDKTRFPAFFGTFLEQQRVFAVGPGNNVWHNIHVQDLSMIYLLLAEAAVSGGGDASWNDSGYYLAENGSYIHHEMLQLVARTAYKNHLIPKDEVQSLTPSEIESLSPWLKIMLGADSRGVAVRARKLLGWQPQMPSFEEEIASALEAQAKELRLTGKNSESARQLHSWSRRVIGSSG